MSQKSPSRRRGREAGFSLVELAVAFGVLAVAMLGAMTMMVQASIAKQTHRELQIAKEAAISAHEEIKAQTAASTQTVLQSIQTYLQTRYGAPTTQVIDGRSCSVTTFPVGGLSWSSWTPSSGVASSRGRATITLDPTNPDLVPITIQIDWKSTGRSNGYSVTGLYAGGFFQ